MEPRDARTAIDAAERAAASGDFTSAERHLRDAAGLQEQALGSSHPDLANTLNNLGIVCENAGKLDDAKAFYQRASEMAAATLPADHPFVATSRRNLDDFTRARRGELSAEELERAFDLGIEAFPDASAPPTVAPAPGPDEKQPVEAARLAPLPPPVVEATPRPSRATRQAAAPVTASPASPSPHVRLPDTPPPPAQSSSQRTALAAVGVVILLAVLFLWMRPGSGVESLSDPAATTASPAEPEVPADVTPPPATTESNPPPDAVARDEAPVAAAEEPPVPVAPAEPMPAPPASNGSPSAPTLAIAEVCGGFSTSAGGWTCDPVGDEAAPGRLAFYTRVRSPRNTTIVHRWYQDDRLVQTVTLRIGANPGAGYRTYSRQTVGDDGSRWRVEARSADGTLLHEEHFVSRRRTP